MWAHIFLNEAYPGVVTKLVGRRYLRDIFEVTKVKLRVQGRGSGHLEATNKNKEAQVPLMLALSGLESDPESFRRAVSMSVAALQRLEEE